jgi:hypothetical protein
MSFTYAGIGSRATPDHILREMTNVATNLELAGYTLRSGGARGADAAFERGVSDPKHKEIFLPWARFNNNDSPYWGATPRAYDMAQAYHPAWERCSNAARKFHARNCHQILGWELNHPVEFVVCWTPNGVITGGTGQALRIAQHHGILIFNMFQDNWDVGFNLYVQMCLQAPCDWSFEEEGA